MKKTALLIIFGFCVNTILAQYTQIPDEEFEKRLISQGIDTEGTLDGQVLTDDIDHITILDVTTQFPEIFPTISDLTGIEDFISLEHFSFSSNTVELVDLSNNLNLKVLVCKSNNLTSLDITNNILLESLNIDNCPPGVCEQENTLTEIDVSNNVNLKGFLSVYNYFFELDFSNNPQLESLVSTRNNNQTMINIKSGNNINLTHFYTTESPNLTCITVDDPIAATNGSTPPYDAWTMQEGVIFSDDCTLGISDNSLTGICIYPNPTSTILNINTNNIEIIKIEIYDVLGKKVWVTTGDTTHIDISNLDNGLYLVNIQTEQGVLVKKVIKQ